MVKLNFWNRVSSSSSSSSSSWAIWRCFQMAICGMCSLQHVLEDLLPAQHALKHPDQMSKQPLFLTYKPWDIWTSSALGKNWIPTQYLCSMTASLCKLFWCKTCVQLFGVFPLFMFLLSLHYHSIDSSHVLNALKTFWVRSTRRVLLFFRLDSAMQWPPLPNILRNAGVMALHLERISHLDWLVRRKPRFLLEMQPTDKDMS